MSAAKPHKIDSNKRTELVFNSFAASEKPAGKKKSLNIAKGLLKDTKLLRRPFIKVVSKNIQIIRTNILKEPFRIVERLIDIDINNTPSKRYNK